MVLKEIPIVYIVIIVVVAVLAAGSYVVLRPTEVQENLTVTTTTIINDFLIKPLPLENKSAFNITNETIRIINGTQIAHVEPEHTV